MEETIAAATKTACGRSGSGRPTRNRKYSRRVFGAGQRPTKRLFTPEIKRFLKDWLVRRRENPYPNREEKKVLANDTGLTYIQICNWFANWRRKLKNVNEERRLKPWSHLIKTYNDRAHGNVEQFSICSEDSIWEESDQLGLTADYYVNCERNHTSSCSDVSQCYRVSSTTEDKFNSTLKPDSQETQDSQEVGSNSELAGALLLSKWLESAARFRPSESNYGWWDGGKFRGRHETAPRARHGRDEVEAAVALTSLATSASGKFPDKQSVPNDLKIP